MSYPCKRKRKVYILKHNKKDAVPVSKKEVMSVFPVKRGFRASILLALALFLLLPFAFAKMIIVNNFQDMYNFGDSLIVEGYLVAEETGDGLISLELQCPGYSKVNSVHLTINKGHKVTFAQMGIDTFVLPDVEGSCDVEATFLKDSINSDSFTLLNDLLGAFDVPQNEYQLGDILTVTGIVFKLDGDDVDGTAKIFLEKKGSYPIQIDELAVINGKLEFSKQLSGFEYGTYYINIKVSDGMNSQYFEHVDIFDLETRLDIEASASKYQYKPGEEVVVSGELEGLQSTETVNIIITFDTLRYTTKPVENSFEYRFFVPNTMNAGSYELRVKASDSFGNEGTDAFDVTIKQIPAKISNTIDKEVYNPGETFVLEVLVLDQSGKSMTEDVHVKITDPVGAVLYEGDVSTSQKVELTFGQYARDGTYTITSTYNAKNLDDTDRVTVNKVVGIATAVEGRIVSVKNSGNVDYDDRVDLLLVAEEGGEKVYYILAKDVSLMPGDTVSFDLSYDIPKGEYTLLVDESGQVSLLGDEAVAGYVDGLLAAEESDVVTVDEDQRALSQKIDQGFSSVTGATTVSTYDRSLTPWFFLFVAGLFMGLLGFYTYQNKEVLKQRYKDYQMRLRKHRAEQEDPLADIVHGGSLDSEGDVAQEEVDKLIAEVRVKKDVSLPEMKKENIGTQENRRMATLKADHVKPGTTTVVPKAPHVSVQKVQGKTEQAPTGKKKNRFSTWNPPEHLLDNFTAKNPVHEEKENKKENVDTMYADIDEEFLKDEKF